MGCYVPGVIASTDDPLETEQIRAALRARTNHNYGAEHADTLAPLPDPKTLNERLKLTAGVAEETAVGRPLPCLDLPEIRPLLARAGLEGAALEASELHTIRQFLDAAAQVESALEAVEEPAVAQFKQGFVFPRELYRHLSRILDSYGYLRDQASAELAQLRKQARAVRSRARAQVDAVAQSHEIRPLLRDAGVTLRQGRYVIPVKADQQRRVKGLVHTFSGSGETAFVEPFQAVALNNAVEHAEQEERREEYRVRVRVTRALSRAQETLETTIHFLGQLELLRVGEQLRQELGGAIPELDSGPAFALTEARHPLLVLTHGSGDVVPIDLQLGGEEGARCLVVSGPNAGGKTVLLKTIGLLHWMAYAGLAIPAHGRVGWFPEIWAIVGDQQSLQADLSTFSAQLVRLKAVLEGLGPHRLVLIDELGAGTNPPEGSALGVTVLEELRRCGCVALVSTHLERLKQFAVAHSGVLNAAVGFDVERLEPTYRLEWAQSGRSQALDIAARLGLSDELLIRARQALEEGAEEADRILAQRDALLAQAEAARQAAEAAHQQANADREQARSLRQQQMAERERAYTEAKADWEQTLKEAREEVRETIHRLKASGNTAEADRTLNELDQKVRAEAPLAERPEQATVHNQVQVKVGDWGRLEPFPQSGRVVEVDRQRGQLDIEIAGKRVRGEIADFHSVKAAKDPARKSQGRRSPKAPPPESTQLDLRGKRRDEALVVLQRYLDNAYGSGWQQVSILHGKGNGVLGEAVHAALKEDRRVATFGWAAPQAGGAGVTEVVFEGSSETE